ncbi:lipopolysaccharide heptosyltransferase family protein [bacterium]|nr:MAG: lipopolysaccharide heptosyltransferase family protein [bacterium]
MLLASRSSTDGGAACATVAAGSTISPVRMVLVRNDKLGDSLMTTPLVATLHREIPNLHLTAVTDTMGREVFSRLSQVSDLRLMPAFPTLREALREGIAWRRSRVHTVIMSRPNGRVYAIAALLSGAKRRIGAANPSKWYAKLLTANRWSDFDSREHFARKFLSLGEPILGYRLADEPTIFPHRKVAMEPAAAILHMGGGGAHLMLSEEKYLQLAHGLKDAFGTVTLTGDYAVSEMAARIASVTGARDLVGETDLDALASLQGKARVTVGVTTGAMHIAAAVGCPQAVGILMRSTDPLQWSPWMAPYELVRPQRFCEICTDTLCTRTESTCMETLQANEVVSAAVRVAR